MKKQLLFASALIFSLGMANGQTDIPGLGSEGLMDDFKTKAFQTGPNGGGIYWWEGSGGTNITLGREGDGFMKVDLTNAGGCNEEKASCYPVIGFGFGTKTEGGKDYYTVDLSKNADITVEIENVTNQATFVIVELEDINGVKAQIEPNVDDVTAGLQWGDKVNGLYPRKALNGFVFGNMADSDEPANYKRTVKIDLSSVPGKIGGLTRTASVCDPSKGGGPSTCPTTAYNIDITKIKTVIFGINMGKDNIEVSEDDGKPTGDYAIQGSVITPYTGTLKFYSVKVGTPLQGVGINETAASNSVKVYPNPAQDVLNVTFNTAEQVSLSDIYGRVVYSSNATGLDNLKINTSDFASGMYILNVSSKNGRTSSKVTIK